MKVLRRILAAAAILCLLITLLPCALAVEDERFQNATWEQVTTDFLNQYGALEMGTIGIAYYNTVTGEEHFLNPDTYITVGSVYKVPLNMLYCERISRGEMSLESSVYGIPYQTLLRGTIIDSNNDYAKILWDYIGSYHLYREQIAPYMGEDAATVDYKFYENNFFTARQMLTCLRLLYENPDRFPYIVDVMKEAEPNNYFHRDEHRFTIAHKYGFNTENYHSYVADSGMFYTAGPFLLVVFTDNSPQAYDLLSYYAVLMCDYTEYHTAERMKADAPARAAEGLSFPSAPSAQTGGVKSSTTKAPLLDMDMASFVRLFGVLAVTLFGLGICVKLARRAGYIAVLPAVIVLAAGLLLSSSLLRESGTSLLSFHRGSGGDTVESFFTDLEAGDYAAACEKLDGYNSLGLEQEPEDSYTARTWAALRKSYSHRLNGGSADDKTASQSVLLTRLSLPRMQERLKEETRRLLGEFAAQRSAAELYDEQYNFLPSVVEEAYAQAFDTVMEQVESCYDEKELSVQMRYSLKGWMIQPDGALLNAISGK